MSTTVQNGLQLQENTKQFDRDLLAESPKAIDVIGLGEGLKLVSRKAVELDHDFATAILGMEEFSSDRPLENNHVMRLLTAMRRSTFLPEQVQIITCTLNGKEYRMNGQHTCWARLEMDPKYRCPVQHMRYAAKTENDMRRLYASIDRAMARTTRNVVCSYLFETPEWKAFSKNTLSKVAEALGFWLWENNHNRALHDGDDRSYMLMTDYFKLGQMIAKFIEASSGKDAMHVRRRPVIAAMFATFAKSKDESISFWSSVRDGTGFGNKYDARLVLRNTLVSVCIGIGQGSKPDKRTASSEEVYRMCIHAWNAYRRGDAVKQQFKGPLGSARPKAI